MPVIRAGQKTLSYGGENLGFGDGRTVKNLGFRVGVGYRNNST